MTNLPLNQGGGWEGGICSPIILNFLAHQNLLRGYHFSMKGVE